MFSAGYDIKSRFIDIFKTPNQKIYILDLIYISCPNPIRFVSNNKLQAFDENIGKSLLMFITKPDQ